MKSTSLGVCWAAIFFVVLVATPPTKAQTFVKVNYPGASYTGLYGINNHDVAVGSYLLADGSIHAFMLSQGTYTNIDVPSGLDSFAFGINDNGDVVGSYFDLVALKDRGFLLTAGKYAAIDFPGAANTFVRGINNLGEITGFYGTPGAPPGQYHGFELIAGVFTTVDCPCGSTSLLYNISNSGTIVGEYSDAAGHHGLVYSSGTFTTVDYPGASGTVLLGANVGGTLVGTFTDPTDQLTKGFKIANGQFLLTGPPPPPDQNTDYLGINDSGQIVGSGNAGTAVPLIVGTGFFLSNGPFAYIYGVNVMTVLDTTSNLVLTTIAMPGPSNPIAVSPDQTRIYACNGNQVFVIDTATNSVLTSFVAGNGANAVAITPDGQFGYVANGVDNTVSVFSTANDTVVATIPVAAGYAPGGVSISPDGQFVYVSGGTIGGTENATIEVISTATNSVISTIPIAGLTGAVFGPVLAPSGAFGYVSQYAPSVTPGLLTVLAIPSYQELATIAVGTLPSDLAFTPDGSYAYVANAVSPFGQTPAPGSVSVIDTRTNNVIATVPVGKRPIPVAITSDGAFAYVGNFSDNTLSIIQTSTNSVVATISGVPSPFAILITSTRPASQSITQPLSPTAPNQFNFGSHNFTVQYPAGTSFSGVNMTVVAAQTTQATFRQRVAGTTFANATCIVYSGAGGNCIDYQVSCSDSSGNAISCPSTSTPSIMVKTSFDTQQQIINPGFLTTPIGTNNWTNIFYAFYLQRIDPTVQGRTRGFSEFVAVEVGASNDQGAATLQFQWPLRQTDSRIFPAGRTIPASFKLTSIADPGKPVTDAKAEGSVQMVSDLNGNPTSMSVLAEPIEIEHFGDSYYLFLKTKRYAAGTYVLTVYGDAFAAQQVKFTITPRSSDEEE
jgi:YVTN family beta-propeller protein